MLPHWRAVDLSRLCDEQGLARTRAWMTAVAARESVQRSSAGEAEMVRTSRLYYVSHVSPGAPGAL